MASQEDRLETSGPPSEPSTPDSAVHPAVSSPGTSVDAGPADAMAEAADSSEAPVANSDSITDSRRSASVVRLSMDFAAENVPAASARDRYGFKKKTNFVSEEQYDRWWAGYEKHARRRKRKWVTLMKDSGLYDPDTDNPGRFPARSDKLKRYVRKGVPAEWRGNAWFWFAKGPEKLAAHPGMYDKLCRQTLNLKSNDVELIERDLQRTFPDNVYFRAEDTDAETPLIGALRRVLISFSVYQPKIGYCQSLNFIAGMLLLFMDEERAFWMLVIITQRYLPGVHEVNLEGVNVDQGVLMLCLKDSLPTLWARVGVNFEGQHSDNFLTKLPPITLCTASWFMSAYIGVLPTETVLRVWDCFFFEDSKIFFRLALTILKMSERELSTNSDDQMEVFQAIQNLPKRLLDVNALLEACFRRRNGIGHITQPEINQLRTFVRDRRREAALGRAAGDSRGLYTHRNSSRISLPTPSADSDLQEYVKLKAQMAKAAGRSASGQASVLQLSRRMRSLRFRRSALDD